ncbi:MAG: hypothetical protein ACK5N8_07735 [Alphaproteobacteria bacterium]
MCTRSLTAGSKGLTAKERREMGFTDKLNGLAAQFPNDGYYMKGYHADELKKQQLAAIDNQVAAAEALAYKLGIAV